MKKVKRNEVKIDGLSEGKLSIESVINGLKLGIGIKPNPFKPKNGKKVK